MPPFNFSFWRTKERNEVWVHLMILANRRSGRRWGRRTIPKEVSAQRHALHERLQNTFFSVSSIKMKAPLVLLQGLRVRLAPLLRKVVTCVRVPYRVPPSLARRQKKINSH